MLDIYVAYIRCALRFSASAAIRVVPAAYAEAG
jgi:hypothetical protein